MSSFLGLTSNTIFFLPCTYPSLPAFASSTFLKLIIKEFYAAEEQHLEPPLGLAAFSSAAQECEHMAQARPVTHALLGQVL